MQDLQAWLTLPFKVLRQGPQIASDRNTSSKSWVFAPGHGLSHPLLRRARIQISMRQLQVIISASLITRRCSQQCASNMTTSTTATTLDDRNQTRTVCQSAPQAASSSIAWGSIDFSSCIVIVILCPSAWARLTIDLTLKCAVQSNALVI
jgi:hypothetical protein